MSNKSRLNWSSQEDKMLKYLRDQEKIERWNQIADKIKTISNHPRTSKQCRERYISSAKFCDNDEKEKNWTESEEGLIFKLYLEHGPKWTSFSSYFDSRSENSIKNRFYNFIRKILRKMNELNESRYPYNKKSLKIESILVILELSKKIQNESQILIGQKADPEMELLEIRNQILQFSLYGEKTSSEDILDLVDRIHKTNCYLRHLGIFKTKNKKNWKLDKKRLLYILGMQNCCELSSIQKLEQEAVSSTKNFQAPMSPSSEPSLEKSEMPIENIFEESSFDGSPRGNQNWTNDFNRQVSELMGEDILPSFNFDFFL